MVDIREEVSYDYQGGRVSQPLIGRVTPGITTRQWLLDNFGEPAIKESFEDGTLEYVYQFQEHINQRTRVLFLFHYRVAKVVPRYLEIALQNDVVTRVGPSYFEENAD